MIITEASCSSVWTGIYTRLWATEAPEAIPPAALRIYPYCMGRCFGSTSTRTKMSSPTTGFPTIIHSSEWATHKTRCGPLACVTPGASRLIGTSGDHVYRRRGSGGS